MFLQHEFAYRIQAPCEQKMERCICGEEILPFVSVVYFYKDGRQAGCSQCTHEQFTENCAKKCSCGNFSGATDYVYTFSVTGDICGCSECIETRYF